MIRTDLQILGMDWTDITAPTQDDLLCISEETGLPLRPLQNCLDPEHLPKHEMLDDVTFVILRTMDPDHVSNADSIEEMTTKVAIFLMPDRLVTVHRLDPSFIAELREKAKSTPGTQNIEDVLRKIILGTVMSFDPPISELERKVDIFESRVFTGGDSAALFKEGYLLRRRGSVYRKTLMFTLDVIDGMMSNPESSWTDASYTRERAARLSYYTDEIQETVTGLLNLHLALMGNRTNMASFRTNEIMRVLTVFSIFFLPLNFIAGIYGMNFEFMPELKNENGYFAVLGLMAAIALGIFIWMRWHGWMSRPAHPPDELI